ncbi:MAG: DUF2156 domain-containing protein [Armatimonadetes bacterium]|nr:DUF2156 domain-containing protein [Armatimonadota bacterium]
MIPDPQTLVREHVRQLILKYGWNSTCYQVLNPGISRWVASDGSGALGYVQVGNHAVVAGAPICPKSELPRVIDQWESYAEEEGLSVTYFGAEGRLREYVSSNLNYQLVELGWQPEWSPNSFCEACENINSVRAQLHRAANKGVQIEEWSSDRAQNNEQLHETLEAWLSSRGLPTLHFLVEPETLSDMRDRRMFVATIEDDLVAFLTLCPIPGQNGWLTEQFPRKVDAPNGTVELLMYEAARAIRASGSTYYTLGMVPLARHHGPDTALDPNWLRPLRKWARAHGNRFYNFMGLERYKAKFRPDRWTPVTVIVKDESFQLHHLRAVIGAFTRTTPELALLKGLSRAVGSDLSRLRQFAFGH